MFSLNIYHEHFSSLHHVLSSPNDDLNNDKYHSILDWKIDILPKLMYRMLTLVHLPIHHRTKQSTMIIYN